PTNNNRLPTLTLDKTSPMKVYSDLGAGSFSINVAATDPDTIQCSDPENKDVLTLSMVKKPSFITGTFAVNPDNTGTFTGHAMSSGTGVIEFQVDDHRGGIVKKSITINAVKICSEYKITDIQNDAPFQEPITQFPTRFKTIVSKTNPKPTITYSISPLERLKKSSHARNAYIVHSAPTYLGVKTSSFGGLPTTISDYLGYTQFYEFEPDTHGQKKITATAKWKVPEVKGGYCQSTFSKNLNVFFEKELTDYGGLPNWFTYWSNHDDKAVIVTNPATGENFDDTKRGFAYDSGISGWGYTRPVANSKIYLGVKANKESCIPQNILHVPDLASVTNYKGIDNLACTIYHEGCHLTVWKNWKTVGLLGWQGKTDADCDGIPDSVETSYGLNPNSVDSSWDISLGSTYSNDASVTIHNDRPDSTHSCAGSTVISIDEEIYCDIYAKRAVNKDLALGNNIFYNNDWASPGKRATDKYKRIGNESGTNATLPGGFGYITRDTNGNGLFDLLEVWVPVTVNSPGTYTVEGSLRSTYGDLISASNFTYLNTGSNFVRLY
ncbi:MAG: hypothetical protein AABY04_00615, partial [Candidatus Micrarchaeota archaeon]